MIWQQDIQDAIFKHIAEQMKCSVDELHSGKLILSGRNCFKTLCVLSVGDTNVVTVSKIFIRGYEMPSWKTEMSCRRAILYLVKHCIMFGFKSNDHIFILMILHLN